MQTNFFDAFNDWLRNTETSIVNTISAISPWLAPLAPAFMTYQHAVDTLAFPLSVAIPTAAVVEILGFSTVSTSLAFWFYNRRNTAESKRAPVEVAIAAFVFYLTLIVVSNVLLDTFDNAKWAVITVRALFTLQSIPAALIVAVRTQHRDLLSQMERDRIARRTSTPNKKTSDEQDANGSRTFASLTNEEREYLKKADSKEAAHKFGVTPRAVQKWKSKLNA